MKTKQIGEYTVSEITLGQMREIQRLDLQPGDVQYHMAVAALSRNGVPVTMDELNALGLVESGQLLRAVADLNSSPKPDAEGNASAH